MVEGVEDSVLGPVLARLLERSHDTAPGELAALIDHGARDLGLAGATVYLADVQQTQLIPLAPSDGGADAALAVDGTLAGWCYRTRSQRLATDTPHLVLWLPLVDGIERMGVLRLTAPHLDPNTLERAKALASLTALLVVSKTLYSDTLLTTVRTRPMTLQAELAWAFMPPRTLGTTAVTSSAVLEPAYEIGGDAFDHALGERKLHLAVVDAMGHDTASGLCAALALAGCRSTRRADGTLADIAPVVDQALRCWVPDRLLTAVFADLDPVTGELAWVNCGHPPPLLIRRQRVVAGALARHPNLPSASASATRTLPLRSSASSSSPETGSSFTPMASPRPAHRPAGSSAKTAWSTPSCGPPPPASPRPRPCAVSAATSSTTADT